MTLTLEERFNQRIGNIYNESIIRRDTPQTINDTQPFIVIKPNTRSVSVPVQQQINTLLKGSLPRSTGVFTSNSRVKDDTRLLPIVATIRDAARIHQFLLKSNTGRQFTQLQTLLQSGNTFAETRLYNPYSALLNTVPSLHIDRKIPVSSTLGIFSANRPTGVLQQETTSKFKTNLLDLFTGTILPTVSSVARQITNNRDITNLITGVQVASSLISSFNFRTQTGFPQRPEDSIFYKDKKYPIVVNLQTEQTATFMQDGPRLYNNQALKYRGEVKNIKLVNTRGKKDKDGSHINFATVFDKYQNLPNTILQNTNYTNAYFNGKQFNLPDTDNTDTYNTVTDRLKIVDSLNKFYYTYGKNAVSGDAEEIRQTLNTNKILYKALTYLDKNKTTRSIGQSDIEFSKPEGSIKDIIDFYFETKNSKNENYNHKVDFRAFISSIKETTKAQHSEDRYIGRIERYVAYSSPKRDVALTFNIAAFSREELRMMWTRINYLTGLAFPVSSSPSGFLTPPLFFITIGNIYRSQPCYIESLDFDFLDETITFNIDDNYEVPQTINVNMTLSLLENDTKFGNSPFYGLVDKYREETLTRVNNLIAAGDTT